VETISGLNSEIEKELKCTRYEYLVIYKTQLESIFETTKQKGNSENISTVEEEVGYSVNTIDYVC
jgi:hypothetical protein